MRRGLLFVLMLLLLPSVNAIWDASIEQGEYTSGDIIPLDDGYIVRVLDVSAEEDIIYVGVEQRGRTIDSGYATRKEPFIIENLIMVNYFGTTTYQSYGAVAKLQISQWVDGQFVNAHFPQIMNLKSLYNVFAEIENTGAKDAEFTVELTQDGTYVRRADRYEDEYGNLIPRLVDVQLPFQDVMVNQGEITRVLYENIAPVRRQPSGNTPIERGADVLFNLYYRDTLLDTIAYPEVMLTQGQSGYIEDVRMPTVMYRDRPEEIELDLLNAGQAYGGIERSKFNVWLQNENFVFQRSTREFKTTELAVSPDLLRGDLPAYHSKTFKVKLTPYVPPGDYIVAFDLEHDGNVYDTYRVPIQVKDGASTRITKMVHPDRVKEGDKVPVVVTVHNSGLGRKVSVLLETAMAEEVLEHVISLGPGSTKDIIFNFEAMGSGIMRLDAIIMLRELELKGKNFDPYTKTGWEIDSKSSSMYVMVEGMEKEVAKPVAAPAVQPKPEPESVRVSVPIDREPEAVPKMAFDMGQATPILVVALVLLVILIILKALFHFTED